MKFQRGLKEVFFAPRPYLLKATTLKAIKYTSSLSASFYTQRAHILKSHVAKIFSLALSLEYSDVQSKSIKYCNRH